LSGVALIGQGMDRSRSFGKRAKSGSRQDRWDQNAKGQAERRALGARPHFWR